MRLSACVDGAGRIWMWLVVTFNDAFRWRLRLSEEERQSFSTQGLDIAERAFRSRLRRLHVEPIDVNEITVPAIISTWPVVVRRRSSVVELEWRAGRPDVGISHLMKARDFQSRRRRRCCLLVHRQHSNRCNCVRPSQHRS